MYIGQFGNSLKNLVCGLHMNADAEDFSTNNWDGSASDVSYDAESGIIGGAGVLFNGSSSKIALSANLNAYVLNGSYSVAVLVKLPDSAPATQPIFARGIVSTVGPTYYGTGLIINSNNVQFTRNVGSSSAFIVTAPFEFESSKRYLIGVTVNKGASTATIYIFPLESKARGIGSGSIAPVSVGIHASYDQGLNFGANLRNTSNQYASFSANEFLVFSTILTQKWFIDYAAFLRGFR